MCTRGSIRQQCSSMNRKREYVCWTIYVRLDYYKVNNCRSKRRFATLQRRCPRIRVHSLFWHSYTMHLNLSTSRLFSSVSRPHGPIRQLSTCRPRTGYQHMHATVSACSYDVGCVDAVACSALLDHRECDTCAVLVEPPQPRRDETS
jgi:hypothetical protein